MLHWHYFRYYSFNYPTAKVRNIFKLTKKTFPPHGKTHGGKGKYLKENLKLAI